MSQKRIAAYEMLRMPVQLCGFLTEWEGLTFATVKAAGHEVVADQPEIALLLFSSFLSANLTALTEYTSSSDGTQAIIGIQ